MYRYLREVYWWNGMKKDIVGFEAKCPNFQQVKVKHQKIGDRMMKSAHLLPVKISYSVEDYAKLYLREMGLGSKVKLSTTFHPQTDGQEEFTIQTLEDMLRAFVIDFKDLEFDFNDWVYLKISPMKGVMRFGKKRKLSPRYVDPYQILRRILKVAYELELPNELATVYPIFHVSMLKKCVVDMTSIVFLEGFWS
ncbi:hypothetical protein MTR67_012044 [Solanum verrucosum]|uniref:Tf2-1-like SH3-like domain-containing protein n=1 Tax=Solanum verrucosum TaxID=315347 RepID=A0AAF0Q7W9_SOLVR|nr:hypothetical protein MTR67_012044 [Solanum verrucosum]